MHDGEANTGANGLSCQFRLRAVEQLKNLFHLVPWDAGSVVAD